MAPHVRHFAAGATRADSVRAHNQQYHRPTAQRGVYAVEFALVFFIFFLIIYAILTYGMIFAAQQSLNAAAEQSARVMLTWQPTDAQRTSAARTEAERLTGWISDMAGEGLSILAPCYNGEPDGGGSSCDKGQARVDIHYAYSAHPLVPTLSKLLVPETLSAQATVDLGVTMQAAPAQGG